MFGGDDDLFDFVPDMDLDGDHDLVDALIFEDILHEEEKLTTEKHRVTLEKFHVKSADEEDIFFEYGIDPDDYIIRQEYEEAVFEAKYGWRDLVDISESVEYDIDPEDYETEDEYLQALEDAKLENDETAIELKINVSFGETDFESFDYDNALQTMDGIAFRHAYAEYKLKTADEEYDSQQEIDRYKFIVDSEDIAAKYLTVDGVYLYAQAIKDHFSLPFSVPDEKDEIETQFETLLQDLVENNPVEAIKIWEWCLDTFMPHIQYADYKNDLTHAILLDMGNFIDEFPSYIINYMVEKPSFIEKIILKCTDSLWCIEDFVVLAIQRGHIDTAKLIMTNAFLNPNTDVHDKARFIEACIQECSNWEDLDTMEQFQQNIFPIVYQETDVRIKNKISRWTKDMTEYIASMEDSSDLYLYSRSHAWREKYRDAEESPLLYDTEEEYLNAVEFRKYRWRDFCSIRYGIDPKDYETRVEYDTAIREAYAKEQEKRALERAADPTNTTLYSFCKVGIKSTEKPFYYYFTGKLTLKVGDHVIVPFGRDNILTEAIVVSIGECFGSALPCKVELIKTVVRKI